jgi:WD40 repeat protein
MLCCTICTCRGEVFQVEWNPNLATVLASSAADKRVMIWDVNRYIESNQLQSCIVFVVDVAQ